MKFLSYTFLTLILFTGCADDDIQQTESEDCTPATAATIKDMTGLDGCGFVLELEDGTILEPLRVFMCGTPPLPDKMPYDPLNNFPMIDGKKVLINYEVVQDAASICMAGTVVKITCIKETLSQQNGL